MVSPIVQQLDSRNIPTVDKIEDIYNFRGLIANFLLIYGNKYSRNRIFFFIREN